MQNREDEPLDDDFADEGLLNKDLPKVLLDKVFDAKFDLDNFSFCLHLQHLKVVCPLFLQKHFFPCFFFPFRAVLA